jgi:hypothetical protein
MYTKRGDVAAYHIVWIGLCLRSFPGLRVLASAVDDEGVIMSLPKSLLFKPQLYVY